MQQQLACSKNILGSNLRLIFTRFAWKKSLVNLIVQPAEHSELRIDALVNKAGLLAMLVIPAKIPRSPNNPKVPQATPSDDGTHVAPERTLFSKPDHFLD
jgi:hypothetical protein